ncbi:hypothetical protein ACFSTC_02600 [Nonomuraea ferruginea]
MRVRLFTTGQSCTRSGGSSGRGRTPGGTVARAVTGEEAQWKRGGANPARR